MYFDLNQTRNDRLLRDFAEAVLEFSEQIDVKVSARGWCYLLEGENLITKAEFDKAEAWINAARKKGFLPVDFVAEEDARAFTGVESPEEQSPREYLRGYLEAPLQCWEWYTPDWWAGERYYIQVVVEKIDLKTLFQPVCAVFKIPIATSRGWGSILHRAEYARRFEEAEAQGLEAVLLYCGDLDPDGIRISDSLRKNLRDLSDIEWTDGEAGYDPANLTVERFGLNREFIEDEGLSWIDNLKTSSGRFELSDPRHKNHRMPYVQKYLADIGPRKCEATAIVTRPSAARRLMRETIERYLGPDAEDRFHQKRLVVRDRMDDLLATGGLRDALGDALEKFDEDA